ncbi:AAA family ATPase, partial [bacterium]|nr:AAA family ATPase [bacterium]
MKIIERPFYMEQLKRVKGVPDIKVITGIRRSGKSKLMEAFIQHIRETDKEANIIYIDFTNLDYDEIKEYRKLNSFVKEHYISGKNNYL